MTTPSYELVSRTLQDLFALACESQREIALSLGLNITDYRALSVLVDSESVTAGKLAEALGSTAATTTAMINRLELHGYVARHQSTTDRRQVLVSATPVAMQKILTLMNPLITATQKHLQSLPHEQQASFKSFLNVVQDLMREHVQRLSKKDAT